MTLTGKRSAITHEPPQRPSEPRRVNMDKRKRPGNVAELARFARAQYLAQDESQVVRRGLQRVSLSDLCDAMQPAAPRAARLTHVSEAAFDHFTSSALQSLAILARRP